MNTLPPLYFLTHELTHKYGGNGLYYLDMPDDKFTRVVDATLKRVWIAATDLLSKYQFRDSKPETHEPFDHDFPIDLKLLNKLKQLRIDLDSGAKQIKNGWIV